MQAHSLDLSRAVVILVGINHRSLTDYNQTNGRIHRRTSIGLSGSNPRPRPAVHHCNARPPLGRLDLGCGMLSCLDHGFGERRYG
jgi:hypothetical protein